jgi:hypothetical protein
MARTQTALALQSTQDLPNFFAHIPCCRRGSRLPPVASAELSRRVEKI